MNKISFSKKFKNNKRLYVEAGWFKGEGFKLFSLKIGHKFEYGSWSIFNLQVAKFVIGIYLF
jgi:hypothetical protein